MWAADTYEVTLDFCGGTGGTALVTATYDTDLPTITIPTRTYYTFGGYFDDLNVGRTKYYHENGTSAKKWDIANDTTFEGRLFWNCTKLTTVNIPNTITSIGSDVFYNCSALSSVSIPNSVTSIGDAAFCGCSSLASITIPSGITTIEIDTFWGCSELTSVSIPDTVTRIEQDAFNNGRRHKNNNLLEGIPRDFFDRR